MPPAPTYTLTDAVAAYLNPMALQYKSKPRAVATMTLLLQTALGNYLPAQLGPAFNLATAVGPQLDIIGQYIGVTRFVGSTTPANYYGFQNAARTGNTTGWRNAGNTTNTTGVWFSGHFIGQQITALPDSLYRLVLQLQIILNASDNTLASIMQYLNTYFPGQVSLVDTKQMELVYSVQPTCPLSIAILTAYLPKPMGVGITVNGSTPITTATRITSDGSTRVTSDASTRVTDN